MATQLPTLTGAATALVEYQVRSDTTTNQQWLATWQPRAADALAAEPQTTAYEALQAVEDDHRILVFERYSQGQQSLDAHIARPAHQTLIDTMGAANMTKRRVMSNLFQDLPSYGWWSRPEQASVQQAANLTMTLIVTRFKSNADRAQYIQLTGEHANYCLDQEPQTLVYSGGLALRDADRGPDIKAGDLLFVAVFADEQGAIKHRDDPQHQALQPKLDKLDRQRVLLQQYTTTGNGFLWAQRD